QTAHARRYPEALLHLLNARRGLMERGARPRQSLRPAPAWSVAHLSPRAGGTLALWRGLRPRMALGGSIVCGTLIAAHLPRAQAAEDPNPQSNPAPTDTLDASESETLASARQFSSWNHYEGPYATIRFGFGFLYDFVGYAQDENSKEQ